MNDLLKNEFANLKELNDYQPLLQGYEFDDGSKVFFEPSFLTQLENFLQIHKKSHQMIIEEIIKIVKKERRVIFVHDYENPAVDLEDFILLEINDVTDPLKIYVEDKSRGSDYGD